MMPSSHALLTPFSTDGTKTRSTFWPTSDCVNSTPVSRGFGSMRIQTSANCPAPPVCFLWRYFDSPLALDRLAISHARLVQFDVHVVAAAQALGDHFQVQLALRGDNGLVQFRIHDVKKRRVLVVQRRQAGRDFVLLALDSCSSSAA